MTDGREETKQGGPKIAGGEALQSMAGAMLKGGNKPPPVIGELQDRVGELEATIRKLAANVAVVTMTPTVKAEMLDALERSQAATRASISLAIYKAQAMPSGPERDELLGTAFAKAIGLETALDEHRKKQAVLDLKAAEAVAAIKVERAGGQGGPNLQPPAPEVPIASPEPAVGH